MKPCQLLFSRVKLARLEVEQNSKIRRTISEGRSSNGSVELAMLFVVFLCFDLFRGNAKI